MTWQKKTISPPKTVYKRELNFSSPPLMRFIGSIGFITLGLGMFYLLQHIFMINPDIWHSSKWDLKFIALLIVSFIVGVLGGLFGVFLGAAIQVKSERVNHSLSVLWHYLANSVIIWLFFWALSLNKIYGTKIKLFMENVGECYFTILTVSIVTLGSLLIGAILLMTGAMKEHAKPNFFMCVALSLPLTLAMGYFQYFFLGVHSKLWILTGLLLSIAVHPISVYTINRDKIQRHQIREGSESNR
jgi:hypothetical protein